MRGAGYFSKARKPPARHKAWARHAAVLVSRPSYLRVRSDAGYRSDRSMEPAAGAPPGTTCACRVFEALSDDIFKILKAEHRPVVGNPHGVMRDATISLAARSRK